MRLKMYKTGIVLMCVFVCFTDFTPFGEDGGKVIIQTVRRPETESINRNYAGNRQPLEPLNFIKLPIGSIRPGGWLKKYLELQRDGLTGKLNEISIWLEKKNNGWYSGNGIGDRGWEEVPYWLKGYGDLGYTLGDQKIITETKAWLEKVFQSQRQDGSFGPMAVEKSYLNNNLENNPDLWPNMIMIWCMQSYYEYSHDARVIPFMTKYFRWQASIPESKFLKLYWENSRGGDDLYSIYWLYNHTGESWLLDLAEKVHRNTANWMQKDNLPNWHNVNIAQCFREPATWYMQSKDSLHLNATYNNFHLIRNLYGQVPGGMFGADENARKGYDDPRQAVETCGIVEQMASDEILAGITGDPLWAENCENVAFNTYPAAVMPDFKALRYLTAPNMIVSDSKDHAPGIENSGPDLMMNPFISRCCQHNHAQGWPYYAEHLWMATPDNGLVALLYGEGSVTAKVGNGNTVTINEQTHYPFDEYIRLQINTKNRVQFPLYLRIPSWCTGATIWINGKELAHENRSSTYTFINKLWQDKDIVELRLPMRLGLTRWQRNKNSVSVNYGPLSFSLRIKENYELRDSKAASVGKPKWQESVDGNQWPAFEIYPGSSWNYGLILKGRDLLDGFSVVKKKWPADDFPFTQENSPIEINTSGCRIPSWTIDQYGLCGLLPQSPVKVNTSEESLVLIPMGAARLRISAFPVIEQ
jgi:hypothetical protein